ncbi:hypothetical protein AA12717_0323 [Gluconacetobacter sacchari DSM 12717]|uniref:Uncharacterized protein n=1 Tax=Gluconacetobacter sacchari DSM 12717 TaxID=1307940 RepID=A0ABQ0P2G3_9PROT|nr:hypothetical protein AA12717_0323 [Gluconacetobacter sacchari DSM 12717]
MALKSVTFKGSLTPKDVEPNDRIQRVLAKHQSARSDLVREARQITAERRRALESIRDPDLRRSAAR